MDAMLFTVFLLIITFLAIGWALSEHGARAKLERENEEALERRRQKQARRQAMEHEAENSGSMWLLIFAIFWILVLAPALMR